jgi:hypothetical protein
MCSIVCLQMRLPSRAGVFLYLAWMIQGGWRRHRTSLKRQCVYLEGCLVMPIHTQAHTHPRSWSYTATATAMAVCGAVGSGCMARSARATAAEIRSSTRLQGAGGL